MTIAFIADLHLSPKRPHSDAMFAEFVAEAARHLKQLYILGDLFDYWVGDDAGEKLGYAASENVIRDGVRAGLEVFFLPGNRDFLVGDAFAARTGCTILPDPFPLAFDGAPNILLTHGDALCTDDTEHQAARATMQSAKWRNAFAAQSIDARIAEAEKLRAQSERNKKIKPLEMMDVNQGAVEQCMRAHNVRHLIHGHTHRPAVHEFMLDGESARRYVLGDWFTQKSALYYADGALTLR